MAGADVAFVFDSPADEARFVTEYLADAWDRFEASDCWETGWFWSFGGFEPYDSGPYGGLVQLVFEGIPSDSSNANRTAGRRSTDSTRGT